MINQQDLNSYKSQLQDQMAIRTFVDNLIKERKDPEVTEETLPAVRTMLIQKVNEAINEHFVNLLGEADVLELDKLLEDTIPNDKLDEFFRKKIDNISVEIATALLNFRAAYLYPIWKKQQEELASQQAKQQEQQKEEKKEEQKDEELDMLPPAPVM